MVLVLVLVLVLLFFFVLTWVFGGGMSDAIG